MYRMNLKCLLIARRKEAPTTGKKVKVLVAQSCLILCDPIGAHQAPLSMEFSRQEYWSG